jgi:hypothetical protein
VASYYHLNYSYGFLRRGLVGTLATYFGDIKLFAFWFTFAASLITAWIFTLLTDDRRLWFLFLLSPATALHLGFDVGRYDHINLLLLAVSLLIVRRGKALYIVPVLTAVGILIHEAYLLYSVPVITASLWYLNRRVAIVNAVLSRSLGMALIVWGKPSSEVITRVSSEPGVIPGAIEAISVGVIDTIRNNLSYVIYEVMRRPWDFILPPAILSGYAIVYLSSTRGLPPTLRFSPFVCLLLFLLGYDYPRWASLTVMVMLFHLASLGRRLPPETGKLSLLLMLTTLLGPLGAGHYAFPLLEALILGTAPY